MPSNTSTNNASLIVPEVIANEALGYLGANLSLGKTVTLDSEIESLRIGATVSIPKRGTVTAQSKTQGSDNSKQNPTATDTTVTVDQHWYVKIGEEDFTDAIQSGSALPGYVEDSVIVLAEKIESRLTSHFSEFPNIDAGSSAGDAYKGVVDVRTRLVNNRVPVLMDKFGYISPRFYGRLLKEEAVLDPKEMTGDRARMTGIVGGVAGFNLFEGQLTPTAGSPAWDQNFFYTKRALLLVSRPLRDIPAGMGVESSVVMSEAGLALRYVRFYDTDEMAMVFQLDTLFGTGVHDVRQGYVLESQG